jgi:hypothetical protein
MIYQKFIVIIFIKNELLKTNIIVFKTFLIQKYIFFLKQQKLNLNKEIYMKKY